jgi:predicted ATPase
MRQDHDEESQLNEAQRERLAARDSELRAKQRLEQKQAVEFGVKQWCVGQAIETIKASPALHIHCSADTPIQNNMNIDVASIARSIYHFLNET